MPRIPDAATLANFTQEQSIYFHFFTIPLPPPHPTPSVSKCDSSLGCWLTCLSSSFCLTWSKSIFWREGNPSARATRLGPIVPYCRKFSRQLKGALSSTVLCVPEICDPPFSVHPKGESNWQILFHRTYLRLRIVLFALKLWYTYFIFDLLH